MAAPHQQEKNQNQSLRRVQKMVRLKEIKGKTTIYYLGSMQTKTEIYYTCPYCHTDDFYIVAPPKYCEVCHSQLPEFSNLRTNLISRIVWHFEDDVDKLLVVV